METTSGFKPGWLRLTALICVTALVPGDFPLLAQQQPPPQPPAQAPADAPKLKSPDQLDSLVSPIALYPDPLLAQVLAATTYPLEVVECARWLKQNSNLKGEDLTKGAAKQPWDPSVQALVAFPTALKLMDENIAWTTDMGNAFLDQQNDVMDAVQRQRKKAKDSGKLQSTKEQKVEVQTVEQKSVVVIQPSDPQVIYVPSYNPTVVWGAPPVYAYPPVVYPPAPSYGAMAATAAISFGVGVAMGAFWGGCCGGHGYGWGCGWGSNNNITINNNFQNRYNYNSGNRTNVQGGNRTNVGSGNSSWQHNSAHRRSVPYGSTRTAQQFGGTARDASGRTQRFDSSGNRRDSGVGQNRGGGVGDRNSGVGQNRGGAGDRNSGVGQSGGRNSGAGGGQDRVGNRSFDSGGGGQSAFGGSGSADRSRAASDRGFSSSRSSSSGGGGGFSGGGGRSGGGGGGRSGGGGGRRR